MARTAPIPNFPAIPGMNPGLFLMGGGGDGGGSGAGGGKGKGNNQKGNGKNGGKDANGDGKGAGACGKGGKGSCANCGNSFSGGDPVNALTGTVFTTPKTDLYLPGLFDLDILRSYSSHRRDHDDGLGFGWAFNLDWHFEVRRTSVHVRNGDGLDMRFPLPQENGEQACWMSAALIRVDDGFILRPGNEFFHYFRKDVDGEYRVFAASYRNRGRLLFHYERGRLARITDTVGRAVLFNRDPAGRLRSLSVADLHGNRIVYAQYEHDADGNLITAVDADGNAWRYAYDDDHNLVWQRFPTGTIFHYRYDDQGRCIETWGEQESGFDPALASDAPSLLADGQTKAKGILHCKLDFAADGTYSELADSLRLQRFEHSASGIEKAVDARGGVTSRGFDNFGRVISHTDSNGATTLWEHDPMGNVVSETDPEGHTVVCLRNQDGHPVEITDAEGGVLRFELDAWGNVETMTDQRGGVYRYLRDGNGLTIEAVDPSGAAVKYEYDGHGNRVAEILPNGGITRSEYDYWGRLIRVTMPTGGTLSFARSPSGLLLETIDSLGRCWSKVYDGLGNPISATRPDGSTTRLTWGGLGWLCAMENADGTRTEAKFNREGWVTEVTNEVGAVHSYLYDAAGNYTRETLFNGKVQRFGHDQRGHLIWVETAEGKRELERNKVGQVVKDVYPDGTTREYEYSGRGELIRISSGDVAVEIKRDAAGEVVGETLHLDGQTYSVRAAVDAAGQRVGLRTSLGLDLRMKRDSLGRVHEIAEATATVMWVERDAAAEAVARHLPQGGVIRDTRDDLGRLRRRQVLTPFDTDRDLRAAWAGDDFEGTVDRRYDYTAVDELASVVSKADGTVELTYDLRQRLTQKRENNKDERWTVDATSNYYEVGPNAPHRRYERGDRLLARGSTEYIYDGEGYLVEKRRATPQGLDIWKYTWGPWRQLSAILLPDGRKVEMQYDGFSRRVAKRVLDPSGALLTSTHWVWDRLGPVHEITRDAASGAVSTRTYLYEENSDVLPIAQRDDSAPDWVYHVGDLSGAPEDLVDGSGRSLAHLRRRTFGQVVPDPAAAATTPFRFPGQYEDAETGLHYNRYRYYDPEIGRYISPDPIGIEGGSNLYAYGRNPIGWIDPNGLQGHGIEVTASDVPGLPVGTTHSSGHDGMPDDYFHSQPRAHSERALLDQMHQLRVQSEANGQGNILKNKNVTVKGKFPPCVNCHRAMRAFADENQMGSIQYEWDHPAGQTNSVRYSAGQNPQFAGPQATGPIKLRNGKMTTLEEAYSMHYDKAQDNPTTTGGLRDVNRESAPGGYAYDDWNKARGAYGVLRGQIT